MATKEKKTLNYRTIERSQGIPSRLLPSEQRAYLAGIVEGEGSIGIVKRISEKQRYYHGFSLAPYVVIANTDYALMEYIKSIVKVGSFKTHTYDPRYRRLPLYIIDIASKGEVLWVLEQILPYLKSFKLQKATLLHTFLLSRTNRKTGILQRDGYGRIKVARLNHLTKEELSIYDKLMDVQPISKGLYTRNKGGC